MNTHDTDQIGAYVLDALSDDERRAFEEHLAGCDDCSREVQELRQVVDVLPLMLDQVEPPADLQTRIIAAARSESDSSGEEERLRLLPGGREQPAQRSRRGLSAMTAALALAAAVVIAGLGVWNVQLQNQKSNAANQVALAKQVLAAESSHALVASLPGKGSTSGASVRVVVPTHGHVAYVVAHRVPASSGGKVYQLWMLAGPKAKPVSAGVFRGAGKDVEIWTMPRPAHRLPIAAMTVEPGPHGSKQPTTKPIMVGSFA